MADPNVFDELTNRLTKTKRCDSGIHTSIEISTDNNKQDKKQINNDEQADSGRDSDHGGLDIQQSSSREILNEKTNDSKQTKKKSILNKFNGFKKIFKKSKSKSNIDSKYTKKSSITNSEDNLATPYRSQSEPDILTEKEDSSLKRCSSHSNTNAKAILSDSELSPEKKQSSLKDAPSYIRTSLRKFKIKRHKSSASTSPTSGKFDEKKRLSIAEDVKGEEASESSNSFSKDDNAVFQSIGGSVDLDTGLESTPKIESTAAKDRIRIAPKNRRRPKNTRGRSAAKNERFGGLPILNESEDIHEEDQRNSQVSPNVPKKLSLTNEKPSSLYESGDIKHASVNSLELQLSQGVSSHELRHSPLFNSQELRFSLFSDPSKSIESLNKGNIKKSTSVREIAQSNENINQSDKENVSENILNQSSVSSKDLTKLEKEHNVEFSVSPLKTRKHTYSFISNENVSHDVLPRRVSVPAKLRESKSKSMVIINDSKDPDNNEFLKKFQNRKSYDSEMWNHEIFYSGEKKPLPNEVETKVNEFQMSREKILNRRSMRGSSENIIEQGLINNQANVAGLKPRSASVNPSIELSVEKSSTAVAEISKFDEKNTVQSDKKVDKIVDFKSTEKSNSKSTTVPAKPPRKLSPQKVSSSSNGNNSVSKVSTTKEISRIPSFNKKVKRTSLKDEKEIANLQGNAQTSITTKPQSKVTLKNQDNSAVNTQDKLTLKTQEKKTTEATSNTKIPTRQPSLKSINKKDCEKTSIVPEKDISDSNVDNKNDIDSKIPAYSRTSLKKVPKRSDYLEKSSEEPGKNEVNNVSQEIKSISPTSPTSPTSPNHFGFQRSKSLSKPPISAKPKVKTPTETDFSFQSRDVVRSKTITDKDTSKNEESKVPDWIKLAKQKQTDVSKEDKEEQEES